MIAFRTVTRCAAATVLASAFFVLPACKGSSNPTSSGPRATFAPDTAAPGPNTVALLSGTSSGASVNVRVTVTGVTGFLGAAFRIKYNTTALLFNGMTSTDSFLRTLPADQSALPPNDTPPPSDHLFFIEDHTATPGEIVITATRVLDLGLTPQVLPVNIGTTPADLVVLNFTARAPIVAATTDGRLDFDDPKQVCDGTVVAPGCGSITVTWSGGGISAQ